ncbi:MAG TPA: tetratricopeptide repeat-containing protein [Pyrinomonadaceae bacterium]|nr:tetratricopeptide repeat-containing protein [Pyrinomonadaceae bacterium]
MRAFIIRPFGTQKEINFDEVARLLISPALEELGAEGRETLDIVEAGNIHVDMFRRLLTADIVVADLSIHNANVFYELGVRHALRGAGTVMLRSDTDKFPFDLQTNRYFVYKKEDPAASLEDLVKTLRATDESREKDPKKRDSPVFLSLPKLEEPDEGAFMVVPQDFGEDVRLASANKRAGDLALLSYEVCDFEWETEGWRTAGRAQFKLKAHPAAKETWERVRRLRPNDLEANLLLGTIYERLGDLPRSDEALRRALANEKIKADGRAEAYSLLGRNAKTRWRAEWKDEPEETRAARALGSVNLRESFEDYERAFAEDLNHFYSGLNALAMMKVMLELAGAHPDIWNELYDDDEKAAAELKRLGQRAAKVGSAVELALDATTQRLKREGEKDVWAEISAADLRLLTTSEARRIAARYRDVLPEDKTFERDSVRNQLIIYRDLGLFAENVAEAFKVVGEPPAAPTAERQRVLLFAGHMIDAPDRKTPRFPAAKEQAARARIKEAVEKEMGRGGGVACGYAGGASGGDILFHEVCAELRIPTRLYLAIPPGKYVTSSVEKAGPQWEKRFWAIHNDHEKLGLVRVLSEEKEVKDEREYMPAWLRSKPDYGIWKRNNLWMLFNALDEGCDPKSADPNVTLIALWDGQRGDGPGGTGDLVDKVKHLGAPREIIGTQEL